MPAFFLTSSDMNIRFGDCRLDTDSRQLFRKAEPVPLSPKAFELLKLLVEERPRALSKDELLERVWPGVFVSPVSLARVISEVRRGVGDRARPGRTIRTVYAFGYAFAADAAEEGRADEPRSAATVSGCWLACRGQEFALTEGAHVLGREPGLAIQLDSPKVSRRHARLVLRDGRATLEDLDSKNGTFVRGVRISAPVTLEPGDAIRIGKFTLTFGVSAGLPPTEWDSELL
jgi:DNA-binding winged helix-turn-helix (wHTH) protein